MNLCSTSNDMFVFLSRATEKHAPIKKTIRWEKNTEKFKETWFDHECKSLLAEHQLAYERYRQQSSAENWCAFSKSRLKLANVIKDKQESFSQMCFFLP